MTKTIVITGATRGIGRATALCLLKDGCNVVLNFHADEANATETLNACRAVGGQVLPIKADVSQPDDVSRLVAMTLEHFGSIDVLVNNAGVNVDRPLFDLTEEDWDSVIETNMKAVFLTSQAAGRVMVDQEAGGHIINLGAITGITGRANGLNYCASNCAAA